MKKLLLTSFLLLIVFVSCSKEEEPRDCCTNIDVAISIVFENEEGENILEEENGIAESEIRLYNKVGEQWVEYFQGNLDYPRGVRTVDENSEKYLIVYPDITTVANNTVQTKIKFSDGDEDIIISELYSEGSTTIVKKVSYNGELKWEAGETRRMFTIVK